MNSENPTSAEQLKAVMRLLPYPVTIVTTASGERKRGVTIGSFTSLSLDPPLISFNLEITSKMHDLLLEPRNFVVHVPSIEQADLCTRFSLSDLTDEEQFEGVDYIEEKGVPVLAEVVATLHCYTHDRIEAGDHSIIIGRVEETRRHKMEPATLYFNRSYRSLDADSEGFS